MIKRSQRLSWLARSTDVGLRARAFFSAAACLRCLTANVDAGCPAPISMRAMRHAVLSGASPSGSLAVKGSDVDMSYITAVTERRPSFLLYVSQCTNQCPPPHSVNGSAAAVGAGAGGHAVHTPRVHTPPSMARARSLQQQQHAGDDQSEGLAATQTRACYCRACASLPEWADFAAFCRRFAPPDLPECVRLRPLLTLECGGESTSGGTATGGAGGLAAGGGSLDGWDDAHRSQADDPHLPITSAAGPADSTAHGVASDAIADDVPLDAAFIATCRTAFNVPCCPVSGPLSLPCGGPSRGKCVAIDAWLHVAHRELRHGRAYEAAIDRSCDWPRSYGAARCLCETRFAGADCGGCARGAAGPDCSRARPLEVRRSFRNVSYELAVRWAGLMGRALHALPSPMPWAPENELEMVHEFNRAFHASNWLNHFHILYFEEWVESVRRLTADYE